MNFSSAFRYPFQNFAKVLSIVLVLTIAFAVFFGLLLNSHDWSPLLSEFSDVVLSESYVGESSAMGAAAALVGLFGLIVVAVVSGFWISGYSVEVVRSVFADLEVLPDIDVARNLKDGFRLFISSIAYWLLFIALVIVEMFVIGVAGNLGPLHGLVVFASVVVTAAAVCVMGWAYFVGMARFAQEGDYRASWQIRQNMTIARSHWRMGGMLLVYMIFLSIIYGIVRGVVDGIFGGAAGMLGITLSIVIYYVFNLMQHFSTQHLIAQYATEIGIAGDRYDPEKDKVDFS